MASDVTESATFYKIWGWAETHRPQILWGAIAVVVLGFGLGFFLWHRGERESTASKALTKVWTENIIGKGSPADFVKFAGEYAGTEAAGRALLMGAGKWFEAGNYSEALALFDRYAREYRAGRFMDEATLGRASCLEATGKTDDAIGAYKVIADRGANEHVGMQAKLALGRLFESKGNMDMARNYYSQVARPEYGTIGSMAGLRLQELNTALPRTPAPAPAPAATNIPILNLK